MEKEYIKVRLADLRPYENNPRINDRAVSAVMESIKQCEYITPIVIDENGCILAGHTRHKAMLYMDIEEEYVLRVTGLTEEQKRKFRLLDNRASDFAFWDIDKLTQELDGLDFGDFDFQFDALIESIQEMDPMDEQKGMGHGKKKSDTLKFGVHTLEITKKELELLYDMFDEYVDAYGSPVDFVSWLVLKAHEEQPF